MNSPSFCKSLEQIWPEGLANFFKVKPKAGCILFYSSPYLSRVETKVHLGTSKSKLCKKRKQCTLGWQYSVDEKNAELQGIVFSILNSTVFI